MRRAFEPIRKRVPKITEEEAAALIRRNWMKPDGTPLSEGEARRWAWTFFLHLKYEPGSRPPRLRTQPERPTAERLESSRTSTIGCPDGCALSLPGPPEYKG
jgi:hypothetical protein